MAATMQKNMKKQHNKDPSLRKRMAGQSRTILLYPLSNIIEEADIESFVKRAALSPPLRIQLFKFQSNEEDNDKTKCNAYAYCTFHSSSDCWLIKKHLNHKSLLNHKVNITFSAIPRSDLEGNTKIIEFGTCYPPITQRAEVIKFLNTFKSECSDSDLSDIRNPAKISIAPGHGGIKGKWWLFYKNPETATKALEFFSGSYFYDTENNLNRFVILNYQIQRNSLSFDRKECFYGITDRILLMNLKRSIVDNDDILLFLQNNGFDANKEVLDIHIIHQMMSVLQKNRKSDSKKLKPSPGFAIVTFESYKLANDAYTSLNGKSISDNCSIIVLFL